MHLGARGARGGACSRLIAQFEGKTLFCPGGESLKPGTLFKQPDLARTLREIAAKGPPGFYTGWVADSLVAEETRGGGIITLSDLKGYKPLWRTPITSTYRGYTLFSMPPASSGGITSLHRAFSASETSGPSQSIQSSSTVE